MTLASGPVARYPAEHSHSDSLLGLYSTNSVGCRSGPVSANADTDPSWFPSAAVSARQQHFQALVGAHSSHTRTPPPPPATRMASSPVQDLRSGAISPASKHAKLHRRATSASSSTSGPRSPPQSGEGTSVSYHRTDPTQVTYEEHWTDPGLPAPPVPPAPNSKIRPYLRKLSNKDSNTLDLSRPAAENESLAGLGINDYGGQSRSASDVTFSHVGRGARHNRSASNTSQFSTGSGAQRPTAAHVHPMRQTPRPYTPPVSYPTSVVDSDVSEQAMENRIEEETRYRHRPLDHPVRSGSISSTPTMASPLHIQTNNLSSGFGSTSQLSLSTANTSGRARRDTVKSVDTTSPSSRTSLDKAFSFIRGRDSPVDPSSRAASIRAARQAYREKEEAKARKAEKESLKKQDRQNRKRSKHEAAKVAQQQQQQQAKKGARSAKGKTDPAGLNEKADQGVRALDYASFTPAHSRSLPHIGSTSDLGPAPPQRTATSLSKVKTAKSRWLGFVTWLRTRLLKFGRRLHLAS